MNEVFDNFMLLFQWYDMRKTSYDTSNFSVVTAWFFCRHMKKTKEYLCGTPFFSLLSYFFDYKNYGSHIFKINFIYLKINV